MIRSWKGNQKDYHAIYIDGNHKNKNWGEIKLSFLYENVK